MIINKLMYTINQKPLVIFQNVMSAVWDPKISHFFVSSTLFGVYVSFVFHSLKP